MSPGAASAQGGGYGVVDTAGPRSGVLGQTRKRSLVDEDGLSEKEREALEADDFIIYGKASIEQYDDDTPSQRLRIEALEEELEGFLEDGIISRRHQDINVGKPLREWTCESGTVVDLGTERYEFQEGDTLVSGVDPDIVQERRTHGNGGEDEIWIVANIGNRTEFHRDTRVNALRGELDGFSVTVFCKEWDNTTKGEDVQSLDWHATTIGPDPLIKNEGSKFGVAEYKMFDFLGGMGVSKSRAQEATVEILRELPSNMTDADEKGFWDKVSDIASQKSEEANDEADTKSESPPDSTEEKAGDEGSGEAGTEQKEDVPEEFEDEEGDEKSDDEVPEEFEEEEVSDKSDIDQVVEKVRAEFGDTDADAIKAAIEGPDEEEEDEEEADAVPAGPEGELKGDVGGDELAEKLGTFEARLNDLESKMESDTDEKSVDEEDVEAMVKSALPEDGVVSEKKFEEAIDTIMEKMDDAVEQASRETAQKMATGETPSPSGGSANDQKDYTSEIKSRFGSEAASGDD